MLATIAAETPVAVREWAVRVAVDGVDGAGKTTFADELAVVLRDRGRPVVRASVDGFHHVREVRYRRGRSSPDGYWRDAFDYDRFVGELLRPLGPGGNRRYRPATHDVRTDRPVHGPVRVAPPGAVLVVDGVFLHRDELVGHWDFSVFLDVPFDVTVPRTAARDGTPADPDDPANRRYVHAHRHYLASCDPASRATLTVDNADLTAPRVRCRR